MVPENMSTVFTETALVGLLYVHCIKISPIFLIFTFWHTSFISPRPIRLGSRYLLYE